MMSADVKQREGKTVSKTAMKIFGNVVFILLLLILTFMTVFMIQSRLNRGKTPFKGYRSYIVLSGSMNPAFDTGSVVFVKSIQSEELQTGDIVTFKSTADSSTTTTHRIVEVHDETGLSFTTKGDANDVIDPSRLMPEQVIGKVGFTIPYIGYLLHFASTRLGTYLLVILPLTVIILLEILKIIKNIGKKKKQHENIDEVHPETEGLSEHQAIESKTDADQAPETEEGFAPAVQVHKEDFDVKRRRPIKDAMSNVRSKPETTSSIDPVEAQPEENDILPEIESEKPKIDPIDLEDREERNDLIQTLQKYNLEIDQKLASVRSLESILSDTHTKRENVNSIISNTVTKVQVQCINKLYNYKTQIMQLEQDLKYMVEDKKSEEKKLDHSVALLKEELGVKTSMDLKGEEEPI